MKKRKTLRRVTALVLSLLMCLSLAIPSYAIDDDTDADASSDIVAGDLDDNYGIDDGTVTKPTDDGDTSTDIADDGTATKPVVDGDSSTDTDTDTGDSSGTEIIYYGDDDSSDATDTGDTSEDTEEVTIPAGRAYLIGNYGTAYVSDDGIMPTAEGGTVYIQRGAKVAYANWSTFKYTATVDGVDHLCFCAEPNKASTTGYYTISKLDPTSEIGKQVLATLLRGYGGPLYDEYAKDNWWPSSVNDNLRYGYTHGAIGYIYSGSTKGLPDDVVTWTQTIVKENTQFMNDPTNSLSETMKNYTAYIAYNSAGQDMVWLEYTPVQNTVINLTKVSLYPDMTNGNSCYSLEGAVYGVYSDSACTQLVDTITTDANGKGTSGTLTQGTYYLKETTASKGYKIDEEIYAVNATTTSVNVTVTERPANDPMVIKLTKIMSDSTSHIPSLAGAQFTIKYYDGQYSSVSELPSTATRTWVIETQKIGNRYYAALKTEFKVSGDDFYFNDGLVTLPIGTITVQETTAPDGYTLDGSYLNDSNGNTVSDENGIVLLNITQNGNGGMGNLNGGNEYTKADDLIYGGVKLYKYDSETQKHEGQGTATVEGATFEIVNRNDTAVTVAGVEYAVGEVVYTGTTDENGLFETGNGLLPYGTYEIREKSAPTGYTTDGTTSQTFNITENGVVVDLTDYENSISNRVIRGDFELRKIDIDSQQSMAGVTFQITNDATGESHTFTTDENGYYSSASSYNAHSKNTNAGTVGSGLWFGEEGVAVNDSVGALPYGTYTITELESEANEGYIMWSGKLTISRDGFTVDLKDVENYQMRISTTAKDEATNSHYASSIGEVTIIDTVRYENLLQKTNYTLVGTLMNKATGEAVTDEDGNAITATKSFTTTTRSGSVDMEFTFDASKLAGADVVVFEDLYLTADLTDKLVSHNDLTDEDQTVHIPAIATTLVDKDTGTHVANAGKITLVDTVKYTNLNAGKSYTITGTLMNKATGEAITVNGKEVTAKTTFKPTEANGTVDVEFTFDASELAGETVVAFETLSYKGTEYAVHADLNDEAQSVHIPSVSTTATESATGEQITKATENVSLTDTVTMKNLVVGEKYSLTAKLMSKSDSKELGTNTKTFTATATEMSVDVTITVDASALAGESVVFFEDLYLGDTVVGTHSDINDEGQTIHFPEIKTTLVDDASKTRNAMAGETVSLTDTVTYSNLIVGKEYTVNGTLMNKATGKALTDAEGKEITASATFTAEQSEGSIDITFKFDGSLLAGETVVAFESLSYKGVEIGTHSDLTDEEQSVHFPKISTTAVEKTTGEQITKATEKVTLTDTVAYENLIAGQKYTMTGTMMVKSTGKALTDAKGNAITVSKEFTAEAANGSVELTATIDASALAGESVVFFESLSTNEVEVGIHADITDEGQTVHFTKLETTAQDKEFGGHTAIADEDVTIIDTVTYENLIIGEEYTMTGTLMVKSTGKALTDAEGNAVTASVTFTAEKADGSVELTFNFDGSLLAGDAVVAFESLTYKGIEVGVHADLTDADQTVVFPGIKTTAVEQTSKTHKVTASGKVTIVDTVEYTNLTAGQQYTLKGVLMDKTTGEAVKNSSGDEIVSYLTFIPETENGSVDVTFVFNADNLGGHTVVVFESLYLDTDTEAQAVAHHSDINDEGQSVELMPVVKTSDNAKPVIAVCVMISAIAVCLFVAYIIRYKRNKSAER